MGKRAGGSNREMDYHREVYFYTTDQSLHPETRSFIYADDLCITSQEKDFHNIEARLTSVLNTLTPYYELNQLCPNLSKTQVCAFHLRNRDAKRELNVVWNETRLINTATQLTSVPWHPSR